MNNYTQAVRALASAEIKATTQKQMTNQGNITTDYDRDYKLAMYFHNFLSGISDRLPSYNFLDKTLAECDEKSNLQTISTGCGLNVFLYRVNNKPYIVLENVYCIKKSLNRVDKISSNSYKAYTIDFSNHIEDLDIYEFPMFNHGKVVYLQKYLHEYQLAYINSKENQKSK